MKNVRFLCSVALLSLFSLLSPLEAAKVVPVGDFRFLGGQHFYNQTPGSLSGNMSFTIVPAVKFNDKFSLIPSYVGSYRGTREVNDLTGGGTLFQDGQYHLVGVKGVYALTTALKLKLGTSYRIELLRETKNESWGNGLFDYRKMNIGFETEYEYAKKQSTRVGVDYFALTFPNYKSLESQQSEDMGRELAGKEVLNSGNLMTTLKFNNTFGKLSTEVSYSYTAKSFPDQPLVLADGSLSTNKRKDSYTIAGMNLTYPFKLLRGLRLVSSLDCQYIANDSTQSHYDANKPLFTADFYDYNYLSVGPAFHFIFGSTPWAVSLSYTMNRQDYRTRLVQDESGNYSSNEKIYINETVAGVGIVYPLASGIKLRMLANYIEDNSNMKYEKTYSYNYHSSNYLMGFSFEF